MSWQKLVPKKYQIWVYNSSCVSIEYSTEASQKRQNYDLLKDNELRLFTHIFYIITKFRVLEPLWWEGK